MKKVTDLPEMKTSVPEDTYAVVSDRSDIEGNAHLMLHFMHLAQCTQHKKTHTHIYKHTRRRVGGQSATIFPLSLLIFGIFKCRALVSIRTLMI